MGAPFCVAFSSREEASLAASAVLHGALASAIRELGRARLVVSGGSTPRRTFELLSATDLDWQDVLVGLVDERFVPPSDPASNEALVRSALLQDKAARADFLPMWRDDLTIEIAAREAATTYCADGDFDALLLGMGEDGHTASWFPGADGLEALIDPEAEAWVDWIDATGCPVAGDVPQRLTLTWPAISTAHQAVLLIFGETKRAVYEASLSADRLERPVRAAVDALGARLCVIWAP